MKHTLTSNRTAELIQYRRQIHKHPELRYEENQTSSYVINHLKKLGLSFQDKIAKTGVVSLIDSGRPGKTLLVRADMDALPIFEESNQEYKSVHEGVMHACGHDAHTSILMGLATEIKENIQSILPKGKYY